MLEISLKAICESLLNKQPRIISLKKGTTLRKILNKHNPHDSEKTIQNAIKMSVHCKGAFHVSLLSFTFVYPFDYTMSTLLYKVPSNSTSKNFVKNVYCNL